MTPNPLQIKTSAIDITLAYDAATRKLVVTPNDRKSAIQLYDFTDAYKPKTDPEAYIQALLALTPVPFKAEYQFCTASLGKEWTEPYVKHFRSWFGRDPGLSGAGTIDIMAGGFFGPLIHTHLITSAAYQPTGQSFALEGFKQVYKEQDGKDCYTPEKTAKNFWEYCAEGAGCRKPIPEYIERGNGGYYHNPDYATGKRHPVQPGHMYQQYPTDFTKAVWAAFLDDWYRLTATPPQRELFNSIQHYHNYNGLPIEWRDFTAYCLDPSGTCNYDGKGTAVKVYKPEEFAARLKELAS